MSKCSFSLIPVLNSTRFFHFKNLCMFLQPREIFFCYIFVTFFSLCNCLSSLFPDVLFSGYWTFWILMPTFSPWCFALHSGIFPLLELLDYQFGIPLYGLPLWLSWKRIHLQCGRPGFNPGLGRFPGEGKGYPLQYSGLEKSMDCIVHSSILIESVHPLCFCKSHILNFQ